MVSVDDGIFELFCVKDELLSQVQIEKATREQQRRQEGGDSATLDQVLLELGMLDEAKIEGIKARLDPEIIDGYRLHGVLGRGGMGTVYRATQLSMEREVAVKILSKTLSRDAKFCEKFLQEARSSAKLNHENIMGGIDCGMQNGLHYFVMELVEGESLADVVDRDGPLPPKQVFTLLEQVAKGLKHAHDQKIVHRDIKPENIMLTNESVVKICDLGLARPEVKAGEGEKGKTCEGTPYYCAPEQAVGRTDIDARADVYALGATLYHLLVGEVPFDGDDARAILLQQVQAPFPDISKKVAGLSSSQVNLIKAMVVKDRNARLESMDDLLSLLADLNAEAPPPVAPTRRSASITEDLPPSSSSMMPIVVGIAIALTLIAGAIFMMEGKGDKPEPKVVKKDDPNTATTDEPDKPKVIKIDLGTDPKVKKDPVLVENPVDKTPEDSSGSLDERRARRLFSQAQEFELNNPTKLSVAMGKYRQIIDQFPNTESSTKAKVRVDKLVERSETKLKAKWVATSKDVRGTVVQGNYRKALAKLEGFRESHDSTLIKDFLDDIQASSKQVSAAARQELSGLESKLMLWAKTAKAIDQAQLSGLDDFKARAPEELASDISKTRERVLTAAKKSVANQAASELVLKVVQALQGGELDKARSLLKFASSKPSLAAAPDVKMMQSEFAEIERLWQEFDSGIMAWKNKTRFYEMSDGEKLKATMLNFDKKEQSIQLKVYGRKTTVDCSLSDFSVSEIEALNRPASRSADKIRRVRFLIFRGLGKAAQACLDKAKAEGFKDPAAEAKIVASLTALKSVDAKKLLDRVVAKSKDPESFEDTFRLGKQLLDNFSSNPVVIKNIQSIKDALTDAYAAKLVEEDPGALFSGEARRKSKRDPKYELIYDFKDPKQAKDFFADKKTLQGSAANLVNGRLDITGRIQHIAQWQGGSLELIMRVSCKNARRPNINLMLSDQGGFNGTFVGVGSRMNASEVTLDASVKRGGAKILLPANLIADASADGWKYVMADRRPQLKTTPGKVLRYVLQRTRRGGLSVKVGSKTFVSVSKNLPNYDVSGHIGFYLDGVGLVLEEVIIEGTLDLDWARKHARVVSKLKVDEITKKIPQAKKPAKKDGKEGEGK